MVCKRCLVGGRVQGVFYRATAARRARELGIHGYARNLSDGRVEVMTALAHYGPLPSGDIGVYVTLDRVAVSRALARLMKLGLVTRARNASDQRTFMVDLTAPAARLYDRMAADAGKVGHADVTPSSLVHERQAANLPLIVG